MDVSGVAASSCAAQTSSLSHQLRLKDMFQFSSVPSVTGCVGGNQDLKLTLQQPNIKDSWLYIHLVPGYEMEPERGSADPLQRPEGAQGTSARPPSALRKTSKQRRDRETWSVTVEHQHKNRGSKLFCHLPSWSKCPHGPTPPCAVGGASSDGMA